MADESPTALPGLGFLRGLTLAVAVAFAFGALALYLPGEVTSTVAESAILLAALVLMLSPVPLFLGLSWRHRSLPRALRGVTLRISALFLVIGAVIASVVPSNALTLGLGGAFALVGVVALIRLLGRAHEWTAEPARRNPYIGLAGVGAAATLLFMVHVVFEKSGHLTPQQVARFALHADLDNAIEYQRAFRADSGRYAGSLGPIAMALRDSGRTTTITLTPDGYTARARDEVGGTECVVDVVRLPEPATGDQAGFTTCVTGNWYPKRRSPDLLIYLAGTAIALFGWRRATRVTDAHAQVADDDAAPAPASSRDAHEPR